jgi:basic membrane protein A
MKSFVFKISVLVAILALLIAGCAPATTPEEPVVEVEEPVVEVEEPADEPEEPMEPVETLRVAIILPSTIDDVAFSQSAYDALLTIQDEMGGEEMMEIAFSEGLFLVPDASAAIRDYASEGFDLIIVHGAVIGTALPDIAPDFPETSFAWGSGVDTFAAQGVTNVFAYEVRAQEGGYVMGTIAGLLSESGVVGATGPIEAGDAKLYVDGFVAGATAANPAGEVNVSYTGSFADVSLMAAAAETHVQAGADVLTATSQSAPGAIGVAKESGVYYLCQQWDQVFLAPESVVACQIYDFTGVFRDIIATHFAGVMGGKVYPMTFANGGLSMIYNDEIPLPADVQDAVDSAIAGIMDGSISPLP